MMGLVSRYPRAQRASPDPSRKPLREHGTPAQAHAAPLRGSRPCLAEPRNRATSDLGNAPGKSVVFYAHSDAVRAKAGIDYASLGNNHVHNYIEPGLAAASSAGRARSTELGCRDGATLAPKSFFRSPSARHYAPVGRIRSENPSNSKRWFRSSPRGATGPRRSKPRRTAVSGPIRCPEADGNPCASISIPVAGEKPRRPRAFR